MQFYPSSTVGVVLLFILSPSADIDTIFSEKCSSSTADWLGDLIVSIQKILANSAATDNEMDHIKYKGNKAYQKCN